jgi:hypothetical protein
MIFIFRMLFAHISLWVTPQVNYQLINMDESLVTLQVK